MNKIRGFTLIELLVSMQLIFLLLLLFVPFDFKSPTPTECILHNVFLTIENARIEAIETKQHQSLYFDNHSIQQNERMVYENRSLETQDAQRVVFNKYGHIQQAKTIKLRINQKDYQLIFNLGQGVYRVEEV